MPIIKNDRYNHFKKYDSMVNSRNLRRLKEICLTICSRDKLRELYKEDENLNNIPRNNEKIKEYKLEQFEKEKERVKKEIQKMENIVEMQKALNRLNHKKHDARINRHGNLDNFDIFFKEVRSICDYGQVSSLADNTCLLKHVMRYYIINIPKEQMFTRIKKTV